MLIHGGVYHWRPKKVSFRNDYCIRCATERVTIRTRTLDVLHLYWIPLLPIGYIRRWSCLTCGDPPEAARTARRSIKVLVGVLLALLAVAFWMAPADAPDLAIAWGFRIGTLVALLATVRWIAVGSDDVFRRQRLAARPPRPVVECPICEVPLRPGAPWKCPKCGLVRADGAAT